MNPIQILNRIYYYINLNASARFTYAQINAMVNDSINMYLDSQLGDEENRDPKNFQWIQQIRDNIYTLIKTATPTPSDGTLVVGPNYSSIPTALPFPSDYYDFVLLQCIIGGITNYARPTTYNKIGPLLDDSFDHPTNTLYYYNETSTGLTLWRGSTGTVTTATLTYIKVPNTFSCGNENNWIDGGAAVTLTNLLTYYATEVSVYNGVTYQIGDTITGVTAQLLTSGQVIPTSVTTALELPAKVHERICRMTAAQLLASIGMQFVPPTPITE